MKLDPIRLNWNSESIGLDLDSHWTEIDPIGLDWIVLPPLRVVHDDHVSFHAMISLWPPLDQGLPSLTLVHQEVTFWTVPYLRWLVQFASSNHATQVQVRWKSVVLQFVALPFAPCLFGWWKKLVLDSTEVAFLEVFLQMALLETLPQVVDLLDTLLDPQVAPRGCI